jgi:thioredoxin-related protein
MKKILSLTIFLTATIFSFAQKDSTFPPPYRQVPTIPPFSVLQADSSTVFNKSDLAKNKPLLIILFDPNCDHCQHETDEIIAHIDDFKKIQIVMVTNAAFAELRKFYNNYELFKYKNIVAGVELKYFLVTFFAIRNLPYLAMYDKKGNLITTFEGNLKVENILEIFK